MAAFKEKVKLVFVSYGSREVDGRNRGRGGRGGFGGDPQANVEALNVAGVNAHCYVSPETVHEWQSWRRSRENSRRCCSRTDARSVIHEGLRSTDQKQEPPP